MNIISMVQRTVTLATAFLWLSASIHAAGPAGQGSVKTAIDRSLAFLVKDSLKWKEDHDCLSCHHGAMVAWALTEAGARGYGIDQPFLTGLTHWIATSGDGAKRIPKRPEGLPKALNNYAVQMMLGLACDPQPRPEVKDSLTVLRKAVLNDQIADGSWVAWPDTRSPIFGPSNQAITALATFAMASTPGASSDPATLAARDRGLRWLETAPADAELQATSLSLLALRRFGCPEASWRPLRDRLVAAQRVDGGWSQTTEMASDAYAAGQALYALAEAGMPSHDSVIERGQAFLLGSQNADGSWPMTSRPCPPTNKGSKNLIPIIGAGSAWATLGLVHSSASVAP